MLTEPIPSDAPTPQTGRTLLSLQNVRVAYRIRRRLHRWQRRNVVALKDVSLDLHRQETVGVIGRNGAGKSTLLRLMAGIISPDRGEVVNFGCKVQLLGMQLGFIDELTGYENAILGGMVLGRSRDEIEAMMPEIIDFSEIAFAIHDPFRTYSDGMKARLGFAVAMCVRADVLLIDELLGVGDPAFQRKSGERLKEIMASNITVVLVSHNAETLRELCDRIVWIEDGVVHREGPPDDILEDYHHQIFRRLDEKIPTHDR